MQDNITIKVVLSVLPVANNIGHFIFRTYKTQGFPFKPVFSLEQISCLLAFLLVFFVCFCTLAEAVVSLKYPLPLILPFISF